MDQFQISENLKLEHLLFIDKGYHEFSLVKKVGVSRMRDFILPGYTFNFCLTKPVDLELKIIVVVIEAHEKGFVA